MDNTPVSTSHVRQLSPGRLAELVLESAADFAIFTADLNGLITSWNSAAERIMGWSEAEAVGQHACMIFTPEERAKEACDREMAQARATGRAKDERWHCRKDGSRFWGAGSMTRLEDDETGEHLGYCKIVRDRTEQHEAGQRLEASNVLLANVLESNPDCLKLLDLDGRVPASAAATAGTAVQLRLIADDGYAGPGEAASRPAPLPAALPRRKAAGAPQRPQTTLL